ncbi:hypothetical protein BVU17_11485 [Haloarcula taiwanensis]|uniref:DUF7322 domain-containing protein n=1 Tax=Haloarcula taiwanensis TaxID=1932004 RepID=A0A2H5A051_9EURY|nr:MULTISPECIES: hypothetical protein [Haloarcula]AUG48113.1 hypothetical protein BVU17_11485 [Haloarcula taiwanensis]RLM39469.1 hypothetical protein DVK01_02595 [Haloarcula sp. Atlit-120R]RLM47366.1 hypothetical protein DVK00_02340 [Haloarcula sp. Atlit-47R]RLM97363.1 hypothetical protein D3D01_06070 [Haloarcula sp. Atlit-7R]
MDIPGEDDPNESGGVLSEKSEYEPEEFDPESLGPDVPSPTDGDYSGDTTGLFVKLVIVFNVALLALSLGPMLAYFEGQVDLGVRIFLVGVIAFGYGTFRYIQFERERKSDDEGDTAETTHTQSDGTESGDHNG